MTCSASSHGVFRKRNMTWPVTSGPSTMPLPVWSEKAVSTSSMLAPSAKLNETRSE